MLCSINDALKGVTSCKWQRMLSEKRGCGALQTSCNVKYTIVQRQRRVFTLPPPLYSIIYVTIIIANVSGAPLFSFLLFLNSALNAPCALSHRQYKRSHCNCLLPFFSLTPHNQHPAHCSSYLLSLSFSAKQQLQPHFFRMGNKRMCCFPIDTPIGDFTLLTNTYSSCRSKLQFRPK